MPALGFLHKKALFLALLVALLPALVWPQDADELFRQAGRLFAQRDVDAAIAAFQRTVELRPEHARAWKALGVAYASRGDFERAELPFRNACERQPSLPDACLYYGRTLYLLNRFEPAIHILRRTIQKETRNQKETRSAEAYRLLALSLEGLGQAADADDAFRQAVRLNRQSSHNASSPNASSPNEDPGIDYAVFLSRQGHADQAIAPLEDVLKRHPDAGRGHLELGCTLLSLDRLPEAAAHLERSLSLDPQSARAHLLLGKVYLRLGKPEAAEPHLLQGSRTANPSRDR